MVEQAPKAQRLRRGRRRGGLYGGENACPCRVPGRKLRLSISQVHRASSSATSTHPPLYSIHPSVHPSIHPPIHQSIHPSIRPSPHYHHHHHYHPLSLQTGLHRCGCNGRRRLVSPSHDRRPFRQQHRGRRTWPSHANQRYVGAGKGGGSMSASVCKSANRHTVVIHTS